MAKVQLHPDDLYVEGFWRRPAGTAQWLIILDEPLSVVVNLKAHTSTDLGRGRHFLKRRARQLVAEHFGPVEWSSSSVGTCRLGPVYLVRP